MSNESADSPIQLKATVAPSSVRLGDIVTLQVESTRPAGSSLQLPEFQKELGHFEVRASSAFPPQIQGPVETQQFQIQLQNFTTGQQILPSLAFTYRGKEGKPIQIKTPEFKVSVEMVPPGPQDKGDIRGIKGVIGPVALSPWWWLLLAFAVVLAAVAYRSQRRKDRPVLPPEPLIPPDQAALQKLHDLMASGWIESGKIKEFYIGISDAVRAYLESGFHCPALERTTGEVFRDLRQKNVLNSDAIVLLKPLLEECDLVKFAKFRPDPEEAVKAHALAVQFVEKTRAALTARSGD